jgi:hypothetical protein
VKCLPMKSIALLGAPTPWLAALLMVLLGNESADGVDDDLPGPAQHLFLPKQRLGIATFRGVRVGGGEEWGTSHGTVQSRLARGRQHLRRVPVDAAQGLRTWIAQRNRRSSV